MQSGELFQYYPASAGAVRSAAQEARTQGDAVHTLIGSVEQEHQAAVQAVEGALRNPVAGAPQQAQATAQDIGRRTVWASTQLEEFADAIDLFDFGSTAPRSVSKLNQAYREASATSFGVADVEHPPDATEQQRSAANEQHSTDVNAARNALLRELQAEYTRLESNLDTAATDVSSNLGREPTDAEIRSAWAAGNLPMSAIMLWPNLNLDVSQIAGGGLPTDIAAMTDEELAAYLLDHPETDTDLLTALSAQRPDALNLVGSRLAEHVDDLGIAPDWVWDRLRAFSLNQDIAGGFIGALEPRQAALLAGNHFGGDSDDIRELSEDEQQSRLVTMGYLMAGASHTGVITRDFLESFDGTYYDAGMSMSLIGSLMPYGNWNKDTLHLIGDIALHGPTVDMNFYEGRALVLKGISYNPIAAAEFYDTNFEEINWMATEDGLYQYDEVWRQNIADFIHSSTVDADSAYQLAALDDPTVTNVAQDNTRRLLEWTMENPDTHMSPETQRVYGDIIVHYLDDVTASVTSPTPEYFEESDSDRDGIEATDEMWGALMREGMRDADVAGGLSIEFRNEVLETLDDSQRQVGPENSNGFINAQAGHLENWFVQNVDTVRQDLGDEAEEWNSNVDSAISTGVDYAVATGKSIASGNPVPLLVEGGKDIATAILGDVFHRDPPAYDVDTGWANDFAGDWRNVADNKFESGQVQPVTVDGLTWDGDPEFYEDLYGGDFTDASGDIMPYGEMDADARRAYSEWLLDPAVQNAAFGDWSENQVGGVPRPTS